MSTVKVFTFALVFILSVAVIDAMPPSPPTVVYGKLTDSAGNPISGRDVVASWVDENGKAQTASTTTANPDESSLGAGEFLFNKISAPEGSRIAIYAADVQWIEIASAPGGQMVVIRLVSESKTNALPSDNPSLTPVQGAIKQPAVAQAPSTAHQSTASTAQNLETGSESQQPRDSSTAAAAAQSSLPKDPHGYNSVANNSDALNVTVPALPVQAMNPAADVNSMNASDNISLQTNQALAAKSDSFFKKMLSFLKRFPGKQQNKTMPNDKPITECVDKNISVQNRTSKKAGRIAMVALPSLLLVLLGLGLAYSRVHKKERGISQSADQVETALVSNIMKKPFVTMDKGETVLSLIKKMKTNELATIPVTEKGQILGIVTEQDVLFRANPDKLGSQAIKDIMVEQTMVVKPTSMIYEIAPLINRHVKQLPVVSEGNLVGTVTSADLAQHFTIFESERIANPPQLKSIMNKSIMMMPTAATIKEAIALMRESQKDCIIVQKDGRHVGAFTASDVVRLLPSIDMKKRIVEAMGTTIRGVDNISIFEGIDAMVNTKESRLFVTLEGQVIGIVNQGVLVAKINEFLLSKMSKKTKKKIDS